MLSFELHISQFLVVTLFSACLHVNLLLFLRCATTAIHHHTSKVDRPLIIHSNLALITHVSGLFIGVIKKNISGCLVDCSIFALFGNLSEFLCTCACEPVPLTCRCPFSSIRTVVRPLLTKKLSVHILRNLLLSNLGNASGVKQALEAFSLSSIDIFYIFMRSIHRSSYYHSLFNHLVVCVFIFEPAVALRCRFFHFQFVCGLLAYLLEFVFFVCSFVALCPSQNKYQLLFFFHT